jgi:PHD/YefM family antitoxin component YafN of YafNO toxin-antitoxin module
MKTDQSNQIIFSRAEAITPLAEAGANVALIAEEELSSWQETAHLLRSPANARRLLESLARSMLRPDNQ